MSNVMEDFIKLENKLQERLDKMRQEDSEKLQKRFDEANKMQDLMKPEDLIKPLAVIYKERALIANAKIQAGLHLHANQIWRKYYDNVICEIVKNVNAGLLSCTIYYSDIFESKLYLNLKPIEQVCLKLVIEELERQKFKVCKGESCSFIGESCSVVLDTVKEGFTVYWGMEII